MLKKLFVQLIVLIGVGTALFTTPVYAADLDVTCSGSGSCSTSSSSPLFSPSTVWYPGRSESKTVRVSNTSASSQDIGTLAQNTASSGSLDQVMVLSITRVSTSAVVWSGTLQSFYSAGEISLGTLGSGALDDFIFTVMMDSNAGNEYQGKQTSFDLVLGFIAGASSSTSSSSDGGGGGGGTSGGGGGTSGGGGGGGGGTTSSPSTTGGGTGEVAGAFTSFFDIFSDVGTVEGTESGESQGQPGGGEIQGENTETPGKPVCWWWLILTIIAAIVVSVIYWMWGKDHKPRFWWMLPIIVGLLAYIGDHYIAHLFVAPSVWCDWMWLLASLAVGIPSAIYWKTTRTKNLYA